MDKDWENQHPFLNLYPRSWFVMNVRQNWKQTKTYSAS